MNVNLGQSLKMQEINSLVLTYGCLRCPGEDPSFCLASPPFISLCLISQLANSEEVLNNLKVIAYDKCVFVPFLQQPVIKICMCVSAFPAVAFDKCVCVLVPFLHKVPFDKCVC